MSVYIDTIGGLTRTEPRKYTNFEVDGGFLILYNDKEKEIWWTNKTIEEYEARLIYALRFHLNYFQNKHAFQFVFNEQTFSCFKN